MTKTTHNFFDGHGEVPAHQHPNGGGWVDDTASVHSSAFIGEGADIREVADIRKGAFIGKGAVNIDYAERAKEFQKLWTDVPIVAGLDAKICDVVTTDQSRLDMTSWHTCDTTHCRAGWAIHLAGEKGYELEKKHGPNIAGGKIYRVSTGRWPNFYASDEEALEDICERAKQ